MLNDILMKPDRAAVETLVRSALLEDAPWGDLTSQMLVPEAETMKAVLRAREDGVLCGEEVFTLAMTLTGDVRVAFSKHDGERFAKGDLLATVEGPARAVLQGERVGLNFIQRLCGIATSTATYVDAIAGTKARIVDTRKTTPGLRLLERYAVRCGGGHNHRYSLSDAVMVKDNHMTTIRHDVTAGLKTMKQRLPHTTHIEVEVDRLNQIEAVIAAGIDTIMLDNFSLEDLRTGVAQVAGRALVEASGGVNLNTVRAIAETGVDIISVGALTHHVKALDLGLDVDA